MATTGGLSSCEGHPRGPHPERCLCLCVTHVCHSAAGPTLLPAHVTRALSAQPLQLGKQGVSVHALPGVSLAIFTPSESPPRKCTYSPGGGMLLSLVTHPEAPTASRLWAWLWTCSPLRRQRCRSPRRRDPGRAGLAQGLEVRLFWEVPCAPGRPGVTLCLSL